MLTPMAVHIEQKVIVVFSVIALIVVCIQADKELLCLVCKAVVTEMESEIMKVKRGQKLQVGSFRMDADGNQVISEVEYARSETHLGDVMEGFCERMDDYAEAKYKDGGERTVLRLTGSQGRTMHPDIAKVDFVQDGELNTKLKFYCETILDEYEDNILKIFAKEQKDAVYQLCAQATGFCPLHDDDDDGWQNFGSEKDEL